MKINFGILGVLIAFIGFSIYYPYAYFNYPNISIEIGALNYIPLMLSLSFLSVMLYLKTETGKEKNVYGFNSVLWFSISLAYLFKDVLHLIETKLFIISILGLCLLIGLLLHLFKRH
jgi:hypothetical protein